MACAQIRPRPTWPGTFRWRVASKDVELRPGNPRCRCDPMALACSASWQNPEELDDARIAALAQAGSESAFREIMRRNNRRLYRIARAVVSDAGEAEDVLQEAYLKAFAGLADFRGAAALSTWLTRITLNEALQRRRRRHETVELHELDQLPTSANIIVFPMSNSGNPETSTARAQVRGLLER